MKKSIHQDQVRFITGMQGWSNIRRSITAIYYIKRIKTKNHVIPIDVKQLFDRI